MATPNYINLGSTCAAFTQETGSRGSDYTNIYITNASNAPLKNDFTTGFATGSSNVFRYADHALDVWFSDSLIRSASGRSDWRLLSDHTAATTPSYPGSSVDSTRTVDVSTSDAWSGLTSITSATAFNVRYPAGGSGAAAKIVASDNAALTTWVTNYVTFPAAVPNASTDFYLVKTASGITNYLIYNGSTYTKATQGIFNTDGLATAFRLNRSAPTGTNPNIIVKIYVSTNANTTELTNIRYNADGTVTVTGAASADDTYTITTTRPSLGNENPAGFPTTVTLLKHPLTNKFLYWDGVETNGAAGIGRFSLVDYWKSGLSATDVQKGLQYRFWDMTATTDTATTDFYRWLVTKNVGSAVTVNNVANVAVTTGGTFYVGSPSGNLPTNQEGWVLQSVSATSNTLVYVRGGTPVGYLSGPNTTAGTSVTFNALSTYPISSTANNWMCFRCTPTATDGYCDVVSSASAQSSLGTGTYVETTVAGKRTLTFTASGTFTPSSSINVNIFLLGGGGGGGGVTGVANPGGGGGGGTTIMSSQTLAPGTTYTITIGTGGTGGAASGADGTNGTASTFVGGALTFSAAGGNGGTRGGSGGTGGAAGSGGTAGANGGNGSMNGGTGATYNGVIYGSGGGGGNFFDGEGWNAGTGGYGGSGAGNGSGYDQVTFDATSGIANRGGGGGGSGTGYRGFGGGSGGSGVIIITVN